MRRTVGIVTVLIALTAASAARTDECGNVVNDYNAVISRLHDAVQNFSTCVANSLGHDSCAAEFNRLRSVYREYDSTVILYSKNCG